MSARIERLRAELALAEMEEAFIDAKMTGKVTKTMKDELREARRSFRSTYREQVNVNPATTEAGAGVEKAKAKGGQS